MNEYVNVVETNFGEKSNSNASISRSVVFVPINIIRTLIYSILMIALVPANMMHRVFGIPLAIMACALYLWWPEKHSLLIRTLYLLSASMLVAPILETIAGFVRPKDFRI